MAHEKTYFYHSFPRRRSTVGSSSTKGLAILESILTSGLLVTPEIVEFRERLADSTFSKSVQIFQKRICFTEIRPDQLVDHAKIFGSFSIEWEIETLRKIGAIPTFYIPLSDERLSIEGLGSSLLMRLGEIQEILNRLLSLKNVAILAQPEEPICYTKNGKIAGKSQIEAASAIDLIGFLETDLQPISSLINSLRATFGFFYPTENFKYNEELAYYRQREWRIVGNMALDGVNLMRNLNQAERTKLSEIDADFFDKLIAFPSGDAIRSTNCQYYSEYGGQNISTYIRRIIVPNDVYQETKKLLSRLSLDIEITAESKL